MDVLVQKKCENLWGEKLYSEDSTKNQKAQRQNFVM